MKAKELPPLDELEAAFSYDPDTGIITWNEPPRYKPQLKGKPAGHPNNHGYIKIIFRGQGYNASRIAWKLHYREDPPRDREIDHINRDRADNRIENLRLVDGSQNCLNRNVRVTNTSGVTGVKRGGWKRKRWEVSYRGKYIGIYDTLDEAIAARQAAECAT